MIPRGLQELCGLRLLCRQSSYRWISSIVPSSKGTCVNPLQSELHPLVLSCILHKRSNSNLAISCQRDNLNCYRSNSNLNISRQRDNLYFYRSNSNLTISCQRDNINCYSKQRRFGLDAITRYWRFLLRSHSIHSWTDQYSCIHTWKHKYTSSLFTELRNSRHYATKATTTFTLRTQLYKDYLQSLEDEYVSLLETRDSGGWVGTDEMARIRTLEPVVDVFKRAKEKYDDLAELQIMAEDEDLKGMVEEEVKEVLTLIQELEEELLSMLTPPVKSDNCDIVLELECGAGGVESMMFVEEVFKMYAGLAQRLGWKWKVIEQTKGEKGFMTASAAISGNGVYQSMKFEGGVHRVQRNPATEKGGRVHTSTLSVAVLPQPQEIDIVLNKSDLKVDYMKSSGAGGQSVNKLNTKVRIIHLPTGTTTTCEETRHQYENYDLAFTKLKSRLYENQLKEQSRGIESNRKIQVGNKDRNEKIRTYNFPQDRVTDHRVGYSTYNLASLMSGGPGLSDIMDMLQEEARYETIKLRLEEFERKSDKVQDKAGRKK